MENKSTLIFFFFFFFFFCTLTIIYQMIRVERPVNVIQNIRRKVGKIPDFSRYMLFDPNF